VIEILALIGLILAVGVLVAVALFLHGVLRPVREIDGYAAQILEAGLGIARNLDDTPALLRTRELAQGVPPLALAYLRKLGAGS
jgi:hypothetical protein